MVKSLLGEEGTLLLVDTSVMASEAPAPVTHRERRRYVYDGRRDVPLQDEPELRRAAAARNIRGDLCQMQGKFHQHGVCAHVRGGDEGNAIVL